MWDAKSTESILNSIFSEMALFIPNYSMFPGCTAPRCFTVARGIDLLTSPIIARVSKTVAVFSMQRNYRSLHMIIVYVSVSFICALQGNDH